jgi:hypothetical protein
LIVARGWFVKVPCDVTRIVFALTDVSTTSVPRIIMTIRGRLLPLR